MRPRLVWLTHWLFWLYLFTAILVLGWLCLFAAIFYLIVR